MVWNKCEINFNTGISGIFCSGDIVTGNVIIEFAKKQKLQYITFEIYGESHIQWTRPAPAAPYIRNYELKEKILEVKIDLNGVNGGTVEKGLHQTNFLFTLPEALPSSFEGSCGYIRYWARLDAKSQLWFRKREVVGFQVANKVDLNGIPGHLTPSHHQLEKEFLISGKLTANVKLYTGFAPSQRMPFEVTIGNEKQVTISRLRISLVQFIVYNARSGYANEERKICDTEIEKLPSGKFQRVNMQMLIQPCPPSTINMVEPAVGVSYVIRVEFNFPYHLSIQEDIPVVVASMPVFHQYDS